MRFFAAALIFFGVAASNAQTPQVPHKIHFAGMSLTIRDDAKREIQKDVDALTKSSRYFNMHAERARTYFPIIEKIFKEEDLPEDFKFLSLQESSLVSDAVSPSNAVGFWQFKDFTAQEMGLRVDREIDERMNIVSASRAAAKYIKQNNWYFNNWVLALQAYQMGKGGVREALGEKYNGDSHMIIDSETYWYVKKFLAYRIAFGDACQGSPQTKVALYETKGKKTLSEIAEETSVDESTLKEYNKWARRGTVPDDKSYIVAIPGGSIPQDFNVLVLNTPKETKPKTPEMLEKGKAREKEKEKVIVSANEDRKIINGVEALKAQPRETVSSIARRAGIDVSKFIDYNDISIDEKIRPDVFYFLKKKKKKGINPNYQVKPGDDLWLISQQEGIRLSSIKKMNRNLSETHLATGTVIVLNNKKTEIQQPEPIQLANPVEVAELTNESFSWSAQPAQKQVVELAQEENKEVEVSKADVIKSDSSITLSSVANDVTEKSELSSFVYEVKSSDTLYGIARQFGATIKELMDWNNKSSFAISPGEKLKIVKR